MADISKIKTPDGTTYDIKDSTARANSGVTGVKGNAESSYRTGQVNVTPANVGAVAKAGDTMTGMLTAKANQYAESATTAGINMNNSDISNANGIYFGDTSDSAGEGLNFYRDASHWDSFYILNGTPYISVNREKGAVGTRQALYYHPPYQSGTSDIVMRSYIDRLRANRLAFLPADQIIIEKTTDGGTTWTDYGATDAQKTALFNSNGGGNIILPLLNNVKSTNCGIRITFTAMKYNVPAGTAETAKYNYWNSSYVSAQERYTSLDRFWFWLGANSDTLRIRVYRATGANSTNWVTIFDTDFGATGWSGSDWVSFSGSTFGGGTTQTGNYWNYRITFFSRMKDGSTSFASNNTQSIYEIRGYGENAWGIANSLMYRDHLYNFDGSQNATFPAKVTATGGFSGALTGNVTGNLTGTASKATADASGNTITSYYAPKSTAVTNVALATNKITKTINGTTTDVVTASTTSSYGITKLNSATNSTSTTEAATPSAVKTAYDLANTANGTANSALSGVNGTLIYDHTYTISNGVATFTPHVYQKGVEVTGNYAASCFTWKYRLDDDISGTPTLIDISTDSSTKGCSVAIANLGYGGHVIGSFTPPS